MGVNQNLQNTANQRSEELKPSRTKTSSGETSEAGSSAKKSSLNSSGSQSNDTNVDGQTGSANRDVETFESGDRNQGARTGDDRDSRNH